MRPPGNSLVLARPSRVEVIDHSVRPLQLEVGEYLVFKKKRLTAKSQKGYQLVLVDFVNYFDGFVLADFHPPAGGPLLEEFLERRWGQLAPRTYNKSFSIVHNFFDWELRRGRIPGDPMLALERAKARPIRRTTFTAQQRAAILLTATQPRERIALRLLLDYGIRKGALQNVRLQDFDRDRRSLTIFTKGETIQEIPLPDDTVWDNLDALADEPEHHYLIPRQIQRRRKPIYRDELSRLRALLVEAQQLAELVRGDPASASEAIELAAELDVAAGWLDRTMAAASIQVTRYPEEQIGEYGLHDLWYRWLARAGVVAKGVTSGERLHKARHSAGQRLLDLTGNLKAVQVLLGHKSINVTGDSYTGWEFGQLEVNMRDLIQADQNLIATLNGRVPKQGDRRG